jgi:hypothetical protein
VENIMRVRDTIAAALAVVLLLQSAALAQAPLESVVQPVPREHAIRILLSNLSPGTEVRVQLATTEVVGRIVETSDDEIVLMTSGQWLAIPTAVVISIRPQLKKRALFKRRAFVIGAAAGAGLAVVQLIVATAASRR